MRQRLSSEVVFQPGRAQGMSPRRAWLAVWLVPLWLGGCLWTTDEPYLANRQPPPLELLSVEPASGAEGVPIDGDVVFFFDAPVFPQAVSRETVWLTASTSEIPSSRRVSLLDCSVTLRPHEPMLPLLLYRAEVAGLYGFDRGAMAEAQEVVFTTGDATTTSPAPAPPTIEEVQSTVFAPRCAGCHVGAQAPAGLDLSTVDAASEGLVGRKSALFDGATLVSAGRHGSSYLMWKLLDLPAVFGDPMPPAGDWPSDRGCGTRDEELRMVAHWIDGL